MTTKSEGMMIPGKLKWYVILALALWLVFSGVAAAEQLYVNESGWWRDSGAFNASGAPISAAVGAADAGDSIYVWNGSYSENVNVGTAYLTLEGEGADVVTVTAAVTSEHIFNLAADYVNMSGFTVTGTTYAIGIYLYNVAHCNISDNNVSNNGYGICIGYLSSNNTLANNSVSGNENGIYLWDSSDNTLTNNTASDNKNGIYLLVSSNNNLMSNNASGNNDYGIYLDSSNDNDLTSNTANLNSHPSICLSFSGNNTLSNNNADRIYLRYSGNNTLSNNNAGISLYYSNDNTASGNNGYGIYLHSSNNNNLANNTVSGNNWYGIYLRDSSNNNLANNTASGNDDYGICLEHSSSNTLTNNSMSDSKYGIRLSYSSDNTLTNNTASDNKNGIYLQDSSNNCLTSNNASGNDEHGIYLRDSSSNNLANNNVSNNEYGICMYNADNNIISNNPVYNNRLRGFYLTDNKESDGSTDNTIEYNNIMSNGISMGGGVYHWNFYNDQADDVQAKNNYWGTTDNSTIDASIYDDEEGGWGEVAFYPFETEPVPCAPTPEEPPTFTTTDAAIALQIAAGSRPSDLCYDVSGDGSVTSLDALMILQAAAGNPEDPITGCGDLDQRILRMYDQDKDGKIDADWMEAASIDLDLNRITQSEYDQVKYAYEHNCPVEAADAPSNTR